jgi:hypothetical protein
MKRIFCTARAIRLCIAAFVGMLLILLCGATLQGQNLAINTDGSKADQNAIVDIKSSSKGLLIPRMTTAQRMKIPQTTGLMVFDITTKSFWYSDGESWKGMATELSVTSTDAWLLTGNGGTVDGVNFIGTTDNVPLNFRVNNEKAGRIDGTLNNTFMGYRGAFMTVTGHDNTSYGGSALFHLTNGSNNTAVGANALQTNSGGHGNTAIGRMALLGNTTGASNVAIGQGAMRSNSTGNNNIAIGGEALIGPGGNENIGIGTLSMWIGSGNNNVALGSASLFLSTGNSNTAIGDRTLFNNRAGSFNVALGANATVIENQSGSTAIGAGASANGSNSTALGNGAISNASNKVRIGNAAVTVIEGQVPYSFPSDGRYKFNVREDVRGLDFILQLRPITYQFDVRRFDNQTGNGQDGHNTNIAVQASYDEAVLIRRSGFIAQEVEKAAANSGYDFSGINKPKNETDHYSLSYESFVVPLVKAVQEQQTIIIAQENKLNVQVKKLQDQDKKIELLERKLEEILKKLDNSK